MLPKKDLFSVFLCFAKPLSRKCSTNFNESICFWHWRIKEINRNQMQLRQMWQNQIFATFPFQNYFSFLYFDEVREIIRKLLNEINIHGLSLFCNQKSAKVYLSGPSKICLYCSSHEYLTSLHCKIKTTLNLFSLTQWFPKSAPRTKNVPRD